MRSFLRGKIIDGAPHDVYAARMHGAQSACNRNPIRNVCSVFFFFFFFLFFGGEGSGDSVGRNVKKSLLVSVGVCRQPLKIGVLRLPELMYMTCT